MENAGDCIVSLIVAIADNGVIGRDGGLPWRLSSDLKRFRKLTMGHPLIMGRKTFQSIGKPLDGRDSIVLTRHRPTGSSSPGETVYFTFSLKDAILLATQRAIVRSVNEIFVIGGAQLFQQTLPMAHRLYLTRVHGSPEGDAVWEPVLGAEWSEISREDRAASEKDDYPVTDIVLERNHSSNDCA